MRTGFERNAPRGQHTEVNPSEVLRLESGRTQAVIWLLPALSLGLMLAASWLTRPFVLALLQHPAINQLDTQVLEWFRSRSTPELDRAVYGFSLLGSPVFMTIYAFSGVSLLLKRHQWRLLYSWDVLFLGLWVLAVALKRLYERPRPAGAAAWLTSATFSFPSTHALSAVVGFGAIALLLAQLIVHKREQRFLLTFITIGLILGIGISRLYLGVHYLTDVVAGFLVGGVWLAVCCFAFERSVPQIASPTGHS